MTAFETDATLAAPGRAALGVQTTIAGHAGSATDLPLVTVPEEYYEIGPEIARGGMGRILSARDRRLDRAIAIKELLSASPALEERFHREMRITARLQHPSIINVHEAGRWPSGVAFYTMKHVEGRPLEAVVANAHSLGERLALLPHVIAVAEALAYAHDSGVIHRDLKPGNVLVGAYGETIVIDWGLAKEVSKPDSAAAPVQDARDSAEGGGPLTVLGQAIGTPAYMPAEQARGEAVDQRTDVYAIGAMLYHLLAGKMPYGDAGSVEEILDRVKSGPPEPLSTLEPRVPTDLMAIVNRAMARDPAERYPSAKELADDLRRFDTGRLVSVHDYSMLDLLGRWLRRNRTTAVVAGCLLLVLAVVAVVSWTRITDERDRARRHRADVESLLSFMLSDLREKLEPIGRLDALDLVAKKADDYYSQRPIDETRPDEIHRRALAVRGLGDVLVARGDLDDALDDYREALDLYRRLVKIEPSIAQWKMELRVCHDKIGDVLRTRGRNKEALAAYRSSLAITTALAQGAPTDHRAQFALAMSHDNVAHALYALGRTEEAEANYRKALAIRSEHSQARPDDRSWLRALSVSLDNIGTVEARAGRAADATSSFARGLALRERLVRMDAGNTAWQRDVSVSHERLGDMLLAKGDSAGALEHFRASLAIARKLASQDPKNAMWQRDLSVGHDRLGDALSATGQARAAIEQLELSLDIRRRLTEQHPDNPQWQRDLAFSHARLGSLFEEAGELDEARSRFKQCEEAYRALGQEAGDCFNAAYCAAKLGNTDRAFEWLGKLPTLGWRDADALLGEATFASLHSDPRWSELIEKIRASH